MTETLIEEAELDLEDPFSFTPLVKHKRKPNSHPPFLKVAMCHFCKSKHKLTYSCFKNYYPTSCQKRFCYDCLLLVFQQDICQVIAMGNSWRCPFSRKACKCRGCAKKDWIQVVGDKYLCNQLQDNFGVDISKTDIRRTEKRERIKQLLGLNERMLRDWQSRQDWWGGLLERNLEELEQTCREQLRKQKILED